MISRLQSVRHLMRTRPGSEAPVSTEERREAGETARRARVFQVGFTLCIINTIIDAGQPVITRWGAVHLDPLLFCTGAVVFAALCTIPLLQYSGELRLIVDPRYRCPLLCVAMAGTVMTSLTLTYGLTSIEAVAGVLLLQAEPVYSLLLQTIFVGERPSERQMLATAAILVGIGSVFAGRGSYSPRWASAIIFATPLFWQAQHVMGLKLMPPLTPTSITGGRFLYASIVLTAMLLIFRRDSLVQLADPISLGVIVVTGFSVYFLTGLTCYGDINRLSLAWTTALVVPGIPILSIVFAVMFLGERATIREVISILISVCGVLTLVLGSDPHRPSRKLPMRQTR